jgi:tetratricopeptide (TPR) repeat protein
MAYLLQIVLALFLLITGIQELRARLKEGKGKPAPALSQARRRDGPKEGSRRGPEILVPCLRLAMVLAALAVYGQVSGFDFVSFDDPDYVTRNPAVTGGLTAKGFTWAFTTFYATNWHPLTWLSHMLDCQLFGLEPGMHHIVNLLLHLCSSLLLLQALLRLTGSTWRSAIVAGIFLLHPLHVESVAWVSERKDVLSAFFGMWTLLFYARYVEAPSAGRYLAVCAFFAAAVMSKAMLVTLPFVLLLLDIWPLGRAAWPLTKEEWRALVPLAREKAPLLALSVGAGALNLLSHRASIFVIPLTVMPLSERIENLCVAFPAYIAKAVWPVDLAVLYPYHPPAPAAAAGGEALLLAVTAFCLWQARLRPYLLCGWLWFCGMLLPVSGLFQNGSQSMADRFTYVPLIGLSVAVVWGIADLAGEVKWRRSAAGALALGALLGFGAVSWRQAGYWENSTLLYEHTLAVTQDNGLMHYSLAGVRAEKEDYAGAAAEYRLAIASLQPSVKLHDNLAMVLGRQGRLDEAVAESRAALKISPDDAIAHNNLCAALNQLDRHAEALEHCRAALSTDHEDDVAMFNLARTLADLGKKDGALQEYAALLKLNPDFPGAAEALAKLQTAAPVAEPQKQKGKHRRTQ